MKTYSFILLFAVSGAVACSSNGGTTFTGQDSGTMTGNDTGSTPTDSPPGTNDTGTTTRDTGTTTPRDTGPTTMTGPCMAVIPRLCTCGMNASCQQMALGSNMACAQCLTEAINSCCPAEVQALTTCVQAMMCGQNDQACWQMRCPMEFNALNQCNSSSQMQAPMTLMGACYEAYRGCFGEFPIQCVGP